MRASIFLSLTAGLAITWLPLVTASAQQTQGTTNTGNTGGSGGTTPGSSGGSMPPGASSTGLGFNLPTQNFGSAPTGTGTSQGTGATSRSSSRRTTARTATTPLSAGLGSAGGGRGTTRGTNAGTQNNRQSDRRAQYVTRIDFVPTAAPATSTVDVAKVVEQSLAPLVPQGATVTFDGSTVVLKGSVASEGDRKLAQQMALLEPGVRSVRNELAVQVSSSSKP